MNGIHKPSRTLQYSVIFFFFVFSLLSLTSFGYSAFFLARDLLAGSTIISFNKGSFYMLGVGIASAFLTYALLLEVAKGFISKRFNKRTTRIGLTALALIFLIPQLVHYAIGGYADNLGYEVCSGASYQWLHARTIVYTNSPETCLGIVDEHR